jgi:hypothetical protein
MIRAGLVPTSSMSAKATVAVPAPSCFFRRSIFRLLTTTRAAWPALIAAPRKAEAPSTNSDSDR